MVVEMKKWEYGLDKCWWIVPKSQRRNTNIKSIMRVNPLISVWYAVVHSDEDWIEKEFLFGVVRTGKLGCSNVRCELTVGLSGWEAIQVIQDKGQKKQKVERSDFNFKTL